MKFSDFSYERPDMDVMEAQFHEALGRFASARDFEEHNQAFTEITNLRKRLDTLNQLVEVRSSIDTRDAFYKTEKDYFDEVTPRIQAITDAFYRAIVESPYRSQLEEKWGKQLFVMADLTLKTFSKEIMEDLQRENMLTSRYRDLMASAQILFEGEERNLSQMGPFTTSTDRQMRKRAATAVAEFFEANSDEFDEIYDHLVKTRTTMAKKLGYRDYVEMAYDRMQRSDYNRDAVKKFRDQVRDLIVPVASKLRGRQRDRIGVEGLKYYDENFHFTTGNPAPKGDPQWIVQNGARMYRELSKETDTFYQFMLENELMDLVAKKGKAVGGFCTNFVDYKAPFIFSNFNGTLDDVTVLTHEAGHAFQNFQSRDFEIQEYTFPTMEAAEIHSMSMEFFTWPWMKLFFEGDTEKFKFLHLSDALLFIPYGVAVDEFQHFVYEHPEASPADRKAAWRQLEEKYLPHRNYDGLPFYKDGAFWQRQTHIYEVPFYYIDYTLAQICAFQFWVRAEENHAAAWADYVRICRVGGSASFLEIVRAGGLISPFDDGCIASVIGKIEAWLNSVDDKAF